MASQIRKIEGKKEQLRFTFKLTFVKLNKLFSNIFPACFQICQDSNEDFQFIAKILSFLTLPEALNVSISCTSIRKACSHPCAWGNANFLYFKTGKGYKLLRHLNHMGALLEDVNIRIGRNETEILSSLLLRCDTSALKSVNIWMKNSRLHVIPYHVSRVGYDHSSPVPQIKGDKNNLSGWVHWFLAKTDPHNMSSSQESICRLLHRTCGVSLSQLRLPGSLVDVEYGQKLQNLKVLSVSGGDPFVILRVVQRLTALQEFTWIHSLEDFQGGPWIDGKYILESDSLQIVDVSRTHKFFHFAEIHCPSLLTFRRKDGWYGNGVLEGDTVLSMFHWKSCVLYSLPDGNLVAIQLCSIDATSYYGRWDELVPAKYASKDYLFPGREKCTIIRLIEFPRRCSVVSKWSNNVR